MRLVRSPVEILRARTMPVWPLWLLVLITPVFHWIWAFQQYGVVEEIPGGWSVSFHAEGSQGVNITLLPETFVTVVAVAIYVAYRWFWRDVDRSVLVNDGWHYRKGPAPVHEGRFTAFPRPRTKAAALTRIAWGSFENNVLSSYTLWTSRVHRYSIERVEIPADLPPVIVVPVGWLERVIRSVEFAPFAVESAAFNARWRVVSRNPRVASAVLHPRMIEYFLSGAVPDGVGVTVDDGAVLLWSPGTVSVDDIPERVRAALGIAQLVPEFALRQFGEPRSGAWGPATMDKWIGTPQAAAAVAAAARVEEMAVDRRSAEIAALQAQQAERDEYFASPRGQLELQRPELFRNGAQGVQVTFMGLFGAAVLVILSIALGIPVFLLGVVLMVVGACIAAVNARRIAVATGAGFWTAVGWMLTSQTVRRG